MKNIQANNLSLGEIQSKEWLLSNGLGGFASSTICGQNTRRYHGLLVPSLKPPTQRLVAVSKVEERVAIDGAWQALSTNQYPGVIHPSGYQHLESFSRFPFPQMTFRL
ncbi:MAG: glycogen debranching enzyme N-terminal domain-containing protein, partial [Bacteroidota bacterium]